MKMLLREALVRVVAPALIVAIVVIGVAVAQDPNGIRGPFAGTVVVRSPFRFDLSGHINASGTGGSDFAGTVTLSSGSGTVTFANPYKNAPACVGTDQSAAASVKIVSSTTGLTFTGTGADVVGYMCVGNRD